MTRRKHLKQLVRARMQRTGESYAAARRHVIARSDAAAPATSRRWHFPGSVPAATALRVLLADAGVRAPHTGEPFTEAMVFGLAGGIGAGMFSFLYEKEDFASFWIAGRHLWQDDVAYLTHAAERLGGTPRIREAGGAKQADADLRSALADHGAAILWVDLAHLPHRALPESLGGGGYHVITAYGVDDDAGTVLVGDLTDEPLAIPLAALAAARARIRKQRNRVMTVQPSGSPVDLHTAVRDALAACRAGLLHQRMRNFTLDAYRDWAERLVGTGKESWQVVFRYPRRFWSGLRSVHEYIEYYGTGGGLMRPLFAAFLDESAAALEDARLRQLAGSYRALGGLWSELADAALPASVPELADTRRLLARRAELLNSGGEDAVPELRALLDSLDALGGRLSASFSMSEADAAELRRALSDRVMDIYRAEQDALSGIGDWLG